ncbi:Exonuclease VII, large subunit, partial [gut metagenome]
TLGIVTALNGAALQDVIRTLNQRYPLIKLLIYPCQVQGERAKYDIQRQIENANYDNLCDTLLLCRGGGSLEDLWAFNERIVVEAVYNSLIPVICGVGHEVDHTLAEFAADAIAPTPTGAAILAVPDRKDLQEMLKQYEISITDSILKKDKLIKKDLSNFHVRFESLNPKDKIKSLDDNLEVLAKKLEQALKTKLLVSEKNLELIKNKLDVFSPTNLVEIKKEKLSKLNDNLNLAISNNLTKENLKISEFNSYFINYSFNFNFLRDNLKIKEEIIDNSLKKLI